VVLSSPSGGGKSTVAKRLRQNHANLVVSISYTTRAPRKGETNAIDYHFVDEAQFKAMVHKNEFLEYAHVFKKNWYGTTKRSVEEQLQQGNSVIFDIDVEGAANIKKAYGERCLTIFILPPSFEALEKRLRDRATESEEAIQLRLATARDELQQAAHFDFQVTNHHIDATVAQIETILRSKGVL
jgi:guanylate kinase